MIDLDNAVSRPDIAIIRFDETELTTTENGAPPLLPGFVERLARVETTSIDVESVTDDAWLESQIGKLQSMWELRSGWDGYSAPVPTRRATGAAEGFLTALLAASARPIRVAPSVVGGVGISFRRGRREIYAEFLNDGGAYLVRSTEGGDPDVERIAGRFSAAVRTLETYLDGEEA